MLLDGHLTIVNRRQHEIPNCYVGECRLSRCGLLGTLFHRRSKDNPIEPIVHTLGSLTQPVVLIGSYFHFGMSFYLVILANAAAYALVGLIVETLRQRLHHT
jgi:hypothetical protein